MGRTRSPAVLLQALKNNWAANYRSRGPTQVFPLMTVIESLRSRTTLLKVPEAADLIGWDKLTLYAAIKAKRFPVTRLGPGSIRIDPGTLADWLDKRTG